MTKIESRITALEQQAGATCIPSAPFWSEAHQCMMENHSGFILPVPMPANEWERAAEAHQLQLTTSFAMTGNVTIS